MTNNQTPPPPVRGSISIFAKPGQTPISIPFQFNPARVRREVTARTSGGESGGHSEMVRIVSAPSEVFTIELEFDALNRLPNQQQVKAAESMGVFPQMAALESTIMPATADVVAAQQSLAQGRMDVAPFEMPLVMLILGPNRSVPIAPKSFSYIEQQFDSDLNPIRATVTMKAQVLSYSDVVSHSSAYAQYLSYQKHRDAMARNAFVTGAR